MRFADASLWALATLVVAIFSLFDAVRTRSYADASFVMTASLLYFNAVWIGTTYLGIGATSSGGIRNLRSLLFVSIFIGLVSWYKTDIRLAITSVAGLVLSWAFGARSPPVLLIVSQSVGALVR
tara:strand:- start:3422 stop:3793 length:372 start_codon:yes stop_codon:yes gene_type:complete